MSELPYKLNAIIRELKKVGRDVERRRCAKIAAEFRDDPDEAPRGVIVANEIYKRIIDG